MPSLARSFPELTSLSLAMNGYGQARFQWESMLAVPKGISESGVREYLESLSGVEAVHDLHIWPMSTTETALTAHLIIPTGHPGDQFLRDVAQDLEHHHRIGHTTLQIELTFSACAAGC